MRSAVQESASGAGAAEATSAERRFADPSNADPSDADPTHADSSPAELRARLVAAQVELEASRGRLAREAAREREAAKMRLVGEVLPVLDDLDRSIAATRAHGGVEVALIAGFELVRDRLERVLGGYGLERIEAQGARFDPTLHEAIALVQVVDEAQRGMVVDEVERGYRAAGRVLRAARVRVGAPV